MVEISTNAAAEVEYELALAWYLERSDRAAAGFEAAVDRATLIASADFASQVEARAKIVIRDVLAKMLTERT